MFVDWNVNSVQSHPTLHTHSGARVVLNRELHIEPEHVGTPGIITQKWITAHLNSLSSRGRQMITFIFQIDRVYFYSAVDPSLVKSILMSFFVYFDVQHIRKTFQINNALFQQTNKLNVYFRRHRHQGNISRIQRINPETSTLSIIFCCRNNSTAVQLRTSDPFDPIQHLRRSLQH